MKTKIHKMTPDEVVLLKSSAIKIDDDSTLIAFYTYHREDGDKGKTFYRCDACYRTNKEWNEIALRSMGADFFRFSDIGHGGFHYRMFYAGTYFTKSRFGVWLAKKLKPTKVRTIEEFNRIEFLGQGGKIDQKYPEEYTVDGTDEKVKLLDVDGLRRLEGKWLVAVKDKNKPRKKYGNVIQ